MSSKKIILLNAVKNRINFPKVDMENYILENNIRGIESLFFTIVRELHLKKARDSWPLFSEMIIQNNLHELAINSGSYDVIRYFLNIGLDPNIYVNKSGYIKTISSFLGNDFHFPYRENSLRRWMDRNIYRDAVVNLIADGVDPNTIISKRGSFLHYACRRRQTEFVNFLLNYGADINLKNNSSLTPLQIALDTEDNNLLNVLLSNEKVDEEAKRQIREQILNTTEIYDFNNIPTECDNNTLLHWIRNDENIDTITALVRNGTVDPNIRFEDNKTLIQYACEKNQLGLVKVLLDYGANLSRNIVSNIKDDKLISLLLCHNRVKSDQKKILEKYVINNNRLVNRGTRFFNYADLCNWVENDIRRDEILELILRGELDPNIKFSNGKTLLHYACERNQLDFIEFLLNNGANLYAEDVCKVKPIDIVLNVSNVSIINRIANNKNTIPEHKEILRRKSSELSKLPSGYQYYNWNIFCRWLNRGVNFDIIMKLIRNGLIDPHKILEQNKTLLHYACEHNQIEFVKFLLDCGLNMEQEDIWHVKPIDIVLNKGNVNITNLIFNHRNVSQKCKEIIQQHRKVKRNYEMLVIEANTWDELRGIENDNYLKTDRVVMTYDVNFFNELRGRNINCILLNNNTTYSLNHNNKQMNFYIDKNPDNTVNFNNPNNISEKELNDYFNTIPIEDQQAFDSTLAFLYFYNIRNLEDVAILENHCSADDLRNSVSGIKGNKIIVSKLNDDEISPGHSINLMIIGNSAIIINTGQPVSQEACEVLRQKLGLAKITELRVLEQNIGNCALASNIALVEILKSLKESFDIFRNEKPNANFPDFVAETLFEAIESGILPNVADGSNIFRDRNKLKTELQQIRENEERLEREGKRLENLKKKEYKIANRVLDFYNKMLNNLNLSNFSLNTVINNTGLERTICGMFPLNHNKRIDDIIKWRKKDEMESTKKQKTKRIEKEQNTKNLLFIPKVNTQYHFR